MGMTNAFSAISQNRFTRKWGGSNGGNVDPYISGYFFTHWGYLPPKLGEAVSVAGGPDSLAANAEIATVLQASCLAVTIPGSTVNKTEFTGLGGVKWSAPTNVEQDNTLSMKFLEFRTLPILSIFNGWTRLIRDYRTGITEIMDGSPSANTMKSNYSGTVYYWTTAPDGLGVEYFACMSGVFPLKDPHDVYSSDITTYDKVEVDIDMSIDYLWREPWVRQRCESLASLIRGDIATIDTSYGQGEPSGA